jgi:hypothetical protein
MLFIPKRQHGKKAKVKGFSPLKEIPSGERSQSGCRKRNIIKRLRH